jgi:hypothetical protein
MKNLQPNDLVATYFPISPPRQSFRPTRKTASVATFPTPVQPNPTGRETVSEQRTLSAALEPVLVS